MARPLEPTRTLNSEEWEDLVTEMHRVRTAEEKAKDREDFKRAKKTYEMLNRSLKESYAKR